MVFWFEDKINQSFYLRKKILLLSVTHFSFLTLWQLLFVLSNIQLLFL